MRTNWLHVASCAAVLAVVPFIYSVHGVHGWNFPGVADLEASDYPVGISKVVVPADLELMRGDGAMIRIRADSARLWTLADRGEQPDWVEFSGNVLVESPEGEIRAAWLEYEPGTGVYTAPALSMRPSQPATDS